MKGIILLLTLRRHGQADRSGFQTLLYDTSNSTRHNAGSNATTRGAKAVCMAETIDDEQILDLAQTMWEEMAGFDHLINSKKLHWENACFARLNWRLVPL